MRLNRSNIPVTLGFGSGLAILMVLSLLSYWELREHRKLDWVYETQRIAVSIQNVATLMREAEKGQREYLLTGEERYLKASEEAASRIPNTIEELQTVSRESPLPIGLINRLRSVVQARLAELDETTRLMKSKQTEAALDVVQSDHGKQMMDEIRTLVRAMKQEMRADLQNRYEHEKTEDTWLRYIDLGGSLLAFGLIITALLLFQRQVEKRRKVEEELRESQNRFQRIASATSDALWDWDMVRDSVWMGEGHRKIFGYSAEEIGRADYKWWVERVHPDDRERVISGINGAIATGKVSWGDEYRYLGAMGSYVIVADRAEILRDDNGHAIRMFGGMTDITERKQAEAVLRDVNVQLEQQVKERTAALLMKQQALRAFASQLTLAEQNERDRLATDLHDNLAQTLAFCKMKAERLLKDFAPDRLSWIAEITGFLEEALTYTRTVMADLRPVLWGDEHDLIEACKWVTEKVQRLGLRVILRDDAQPKPLDKEVLIATYQSIQELLTNVVKHARTNRATLDVLRSDNYVEVIVTDQGVGFDPMAPRTVSRESGFGLFSIRERIPLLGGSFETISSPNKGTIAKIRVPLKSALKDVEQGELGTAARFSKPKNAQLYRILLADDHRIMREGLRNMLEGYEDFAVVGEAADGESAVEVTLCSHPDVVLMDVNMPIRNGIEATRLIKSKFPDVVVIGLSLYEDEKTISAMIEAGASACFSKAKSIDNIYAAIRTTRN